MAPAFKPRSGKPETAISQMHCVERLRFIPTSCLSIIIAKHANVTLSLELHITGVFVVAVDFRRSSPSSIVSNPWPLL